MKDIDLSTLSKEELIKLILSKNEKIDDFNDILLNKEKELIEVKNNNQELSDKIDLKEKELIEKNQELYKEKSFVKALSNKLSLLEKRIATINAEKEELLKLLNKKGFIIEKQTKEIFGSKSEQIQYLQNNEEFIFNEAESETSLDVNKELKNKNKKVGRKKETLNYKGLINVEKEEKTIETSEEFCPNCNSNLKDDKDETYVKLIHIKERFIKLIIKFKKKRCPKCDYTSREDDIDVFGKSLLSNSLAGYLVQEKYVKGVPLYRLESILEKEGIKLSRQLQANYLINIASELQPIYEKMKKDLINTRVKVIHADETTLKVIKTDDEKRKTSYMWLYGTSIYDPNRILIYDYKLNRSGQNPKEFLKDYSGYLVCDGYSGYNNIPNVSLARCYFHVRKKYAEILNSNKIKDKSSSIANKVIKILEKAFYLEKTYMEKDLTLNEIYNRRQTEIKPIIDEFFKIIKEVYPLSAYPLKDAIEYSLKNEKELYTFINDPYIPMTNNLAERAIKSFVINRKNFLFSYTNKGAEASAIIMSITQTARNNLLQVDKYIEYVLSNLHNVKESQIESLLPYSDNLPADIKVKIK